MATLTPHDAADAVIKLFEVMRKDAKNFARFEKLNGDKPFDVMQFTPNDYHPVKALNPDGTANVWQIDIGNRWSLRVYNERPYWLNPNEAEYAFSWLHDGSFCNSQVLGVDSNGMVMFSRSVPACSDDVLHYATDHWENIFTEIRRRATTTIREHRKYLHNQSFYDMVVSEFGIKTRKLTK